jgi:hypothetical protein
MAFFWENMAQSSHIVREKNKFEFAIFRQYFLPYCKIIAQFLNFSTFLSKYSQSWLSPLVDDHQPNALHKFEKKRKKKKEKKAIGKKMLKKWRSYP